MGGATGASVEDTVSEIVESNTISKSRSQKKYIAKKFKSGALVKFFEKLKTHVLLCNNAALPFLESFNKFAEFIAVARNNDRVKHGEIFFARFSHQHVLPMSLQVTHKIADLRDISEGLVYSLNLKPSLDRIEMMSSIITALSSVEGMIEELDDSGQRLSNPLAAINMETKRSENRKDKYFKNIMKLSEALDELKQRMEKCLGDLLSLKNEMKRKLEEYRNPTTTTTTTTTISTTASSSDRIPVYSKSGRQIGFVAPWAIPTISPAEAIPAKRTYKSWADVSSDEEDN